MLNWFLQLVFDKFDCIFIDNSLDLKYKKLNCFLGRELKVSYMWFLKHRGLTVYVNSLSNCCFHGRSFKGFSIVFPAA